MAAWWWSGDPIRFLAVLVVATPCPLLIAIRVAIIGSISLAARRGIIVRDRNASAGERFAAARARGKARREDVSAVVDARYDRALDAVQLLFRGGGTMTIPRRFIPRLEEQSAAALESVSVSPAGDALSWTTLDADVYVPGLVERAFGHRLFAAAAGRRGGRRRSKAKAAAARRNGAKGGRPKKRPAA